MANMLDILAIDAGQTNVRFAILNEGKRILGGETGDGVTNILQVGSAARLKDYIKAIYDRISKDIGSPAFRMVSIGYTGISRNRLEFGIVHNIFKTHFPESAIILENDIYATHVANLGAEPGITLHAGTGAFAFGVDRTGRSMQTGGWGYLLGDEGAGFGLGIAGLKAALCAWEGSGPESSLKDEVLSFYGLPAFEDIKTLVYSENFRRSQIADFAKVVFSKSEEGDEISREILGKGARKMVQLVKPILALLGFEQADIVLTGKIYSKNPQYCTKTRELLREVYSQGINLTVRVGNKSSLDGALWIALNKMGNYM